jgi:hypothetical protein
MKMIIGIAMLALLAIAFSVFMVKTGGWGCFFFVWGWSIGLTAWVWVAVKLIGT